MSNLSPRISRLEKNIIINSGCDFFQRSTSTASIGTTFTYVADRFAVLGSSAGTLTCSQETGSLPTTENIKSAIKLLGVGTPVAGLIEKYTLKYTVEGFDYLPISNGKKVTLSFWVKSHVAGTYCVSFNNSDNSRSLVKEYTISAGEVDTWVKRYIQFTTDTQGTWLANNGVGMVINWRLLAPTGTYLAPDATNWYPNNYWTTSNQVNAMATAGNTFYLTGVMLYEGWTENSGFYRAGRTIQEELAYCQRYCFKATQGTAGSALGLGLNYQTTGSQITMHFPTMRVGPTLKTGASVASDFQLSNGGVIFTATGLPNNGGQVTLNAMSINTPSTGLTAQAAITLMTKTANAILYLDSEF